MCLANLSFKLKSVRKLYFTTLIAYLLSLFLSSCAQTSRTITTGTPPQFENLALIASERLPGIERADSHIERAVEGIRPGATVGTMGGVVVGSAACGPWLFPICVLQFGLLGLLAGGVAGGALYSTTGLSEVDALYVNEALSRIDQERDFQQELIAHLELQLPPEIQSTPEQADVQVLAGLARINFIQRSRDEIQIEIFGLLAFSWEIENKHFATHTIGFKAGSKKEDIDTWLANDSKMFEVAIEEGIAELSSKMTSALLMLQRERGR